MNTRIRNSIIAFGVLAGSATVATGLMTFQGETKEASASAVCEQAAWPMIPAECLDGNARQHVRYVAPDAASAGDASPTSLAMQERFDIAFQ